MAGFFLFMNKNINSSVIVTDIDPDTVINVDGEFFLLDMDNNLINDFIIFKDSGVYSFEGYSSTTIRFRQFIGAGPQGTFQNKLLAGHYYNSWNGAEYYQPYPLLPGELISGDEQFYNFGVQVICAAHYKNFYSDPVLHTGPGYWRGFDFDGIENRYLGVSFVDDESNRYYGWIRCSTADSMKAIIIHEFAYESSPNVPIVAGDTVSYVSINELNVASGLVIWNYGSNVYYQNPDYHDSVLKILNNVGVVVYNTPLTSISGSINLDFLPKGMYFLVISGFKKSIQIII